MDYIIFLITVPNIELGKQIGHFLVREKLAACVNLIPSIHSIYSWKGKIEESDELLLVIKTIEQKSVKLIEKVKELHTYDTPECVGIKIEKGSKQYLEWIRESVE